MEAFHMDPPHPGPVDASLLHEQSEHRSSAIEEMGPLRCINHGGGTWITNDCRVTKSLRLAGFYTVSLIGNIRLNHALITALVERWRSETNTFHLRWGEATITLQDVALVLGMVVHGGPISGSPLSDNELKNCCIKLLGKAPPLSKNLVQFKWLKDNFSTIPMNCSNEQIACHTRAYILYLIGTVLLPDKTGTSISLIYLPLLADLAKCRKLAWGSAVLGTLYRELRYACKKSSKDIAGCLILLQIWSWERLDIGRPTLKVPYGEGGDELEENLANEVPLGARWRSTNVKKCDPDSLKGYRQRLDTMDESKFTWQPYSEEIIQKLSPIYSEGRVIWHLRTPLICFAIVEWHNPDRVLRQFGLHQHIPRNAESIEVVDRRGHADTNWLEYHSKYINQWANRLRTVQYEATLGMTPNEARENYLRWYYKHTRRFISSIESGHIEPVFANTLFHINRILQQDTRDAGRDAQARCNQAIKFIGDFVTEHGLVEYPSHAKVQPKKTAKRRRKKSGI